VPALDVAATVCAVAFLVCDALGARAPGAAAGLLAGALSLARLPLWRAWGSRRNPMLLILVCGYTWVALGFIMRGLALWSPAVAALGVHAHAVGGAGVLIYGMMPRVSLGHTGRPIRAGKALAAGFLLINAAALLRVLVAGLAPRHYLGAVLGAGGLWIVAFAIFVAAFARVLTSPRADGREG
jgi:uncharacterized protein involved in response to NO